MIVCISDLHIGYRDKALALLEKFCQDILPHAERLYIIGDLFHLWVANRQITENASMAHACRLLTTAVRQHGVALFVQRGNRDVLLTKQISRILPCQLLPDECLLDGYGTPYLIMHGDQLCTLDVAFQRARKLVHIAHRRLGFQYLPYRWLKKLVYLVSQNAKETSAQKADVYMDVTRQAVMCALQQFGTTRMVHGHTHKPHHHQWTTNGIDYDRFVLGSWDDGQAVYATIDITGVQLHTIAL